MDVKEALRKNRSYRRYYQDVEVSRKDLETIVEAARYSPSAKNIQPLKYIISNDRDLNSKIFETLSWAGLLKDWKGPEEGERPSAYIIQLHDKNISPVYMCDDGITAQSMLLQAVELGFGGCIIASVKRETLSKILSLKENFSIINVIAIGKPKETIVIDDMEDDNWKYWREKDGTHHVPKRKLSEIILSALLILALTLSISGCRYFNKSNPYNLNIIDSIEEYNESINKDGDNKLVNLKTLIPNIVLDIRYADTANFTHTKIYDDAQAFLRLPAAEAIKSAQEELNKSGIGIKVYDSYRPYSATLYFYEVCKDTNFVAFPGTGSVHNRGCAIDLTLIDLATGSELEMPTIFDDFSPKAAPYYDDLPMNIITNRRKLQYIMKKNGFEVHPSEWWHFNFKSDKEFAIMNIPFEEL